MAVFTEVSFEEAAALVERLSLGQLTALRGITAGIENSNFFVDVRHQTGSRTFVLTLFERLAREQLPFYLELMQHLAQRRIPVPEPHADATGTLLHTIAGKPAALVDKLEGGHQLAPDLHHCEQVAAMLARMHLAGQGFRLAQPNLRGIDWWRETVPVVAPVLDPPTRELLESELAFQSALAGSPAHAALPRGPIHADLFRDNVMFVDDRLSGFFDFYFAGVDAFGFDIAVCLNDWCIDLDSGRLDETRAAAFVGAYETERALTGGERRLMPALLRAAALRFWLSRLVDLHLPRDAALLKAHDPTHFERVLRDRIERPWHPEA
jgi:homoserine kinase type II